MPIDDANDEATVVAAWEALDLAAREPPHVRFPIQKLVDAYRQPARHYHNLRHIAQCLRELDLVRRQCDDPLAVTAALLFHDCVYDPAQPGNEERSAAADCADTAAAGRR